MSDLFAEIARRTAAGEAVSLCTVVRARGSTPQGAGAKMLVLADGRTLGTLGGGCVEAEVRVRALALLHAGGSETLSFKLDHDYGWDDGLICGGVLDVAARTLTADDAATYRALAEAIAHDRPATFSVPVTLDGRDSTYAEAIDPAPTLVIAGAGHIGTALADLATTLGFRVDVVDDRPDLLTADRFPTARHLIGGDIEAALRRYPFDGRAYAVIVTRGHRHDGAALSAVVDSPARYVGLIGSRRKVRTILGDLRGRGVSRESLARVHAPIGLEIGAVTVEEIAVSIAAELVAVRRGRDGLAATPMKIAAEKLDAWLDRDALESV